MFEEESYGYAQQYEQEGILSGLLSGIMGAIFFLFLLFSLDDN